MQRGPYSAYMIFPLFLHSGLPLCRGSGLSGHTRGTLFCSRGLALSLLAPRLDALSADALQVLDLIKPVTDTVVIGTGHRLVEVPTHIQEALRHRNIGIEPADTATAIGIYNTLVSDGRAVAAFLFPVQ